MGNARRTVLLPHPTKHRHRRRATAKDVRRSQLGGHGIVIHPLYGQDQHVIALLNVQPVAPVRDRGELVQAGSRVAVDVDVGEDGHFLAKGSSVSGAAANGSCALNSRFWH